MGFGVSLKEEVALIDIVLQTLLDDACVECLSFVHMKL